MYIYITFLDELLKYEIWKKWKCENIEYTTISLDPN